MEKNYKKYLAEFECVYPESKPVFNWHSMVVEAKEFEQRKYPRALFTYDSA
jgi:hypothetical protein